MQRRHLVVIGVVGLVALGVLGAAYYFRPLPGREALLGSWEGAGSSRSAIEATVGQTKESIPITLHSTSQATFYPDGKLAWRLDCKAEGFHMTLEVPSAEKPKEFGVWKVVRAEGKDLIVAMGFAPGAAKEYRIAFRGRNVFEWTSLSPAGDSDGTLVFKRVVGQK